MDIRRITKFTGFVIGAFLCFWIGVGIVNILENTLWNEIENCSTSGIEQFNDIIAPSYQTTPWKTIKPNQAFEKAALIESKTIQGMGFTQFVPDQYSVYTYRTPNNPGYIIAVSVLPNDCIHDLVKISEVYWATKIDE